MRQNFVISDSFIILPYVHRYPLVSLLQVRSREDRGTTWFCVPRIEPGTRHWPYTLDMRNCHGYNHESDDASSHAGSTAAASLTGSIAMPSIHSSRYVCTMRAHWCYKCVS